MPRIKELVRTATLERHFREGLVERVEVIYDGERWSVCVHYNEKAEGAKTRWLTTERIPGPRRFAGLEAVWSILRRNGITTTGVRDASPEEKQQLREGESLPMPQGHG